MIVRIHMDDQYRLSDEATTEVDRLDDALQVAVDSQDATGFSGALTALLTYVRANGQKVPADELVPSDLILPSDDMSLAEAHSLMDKAPVTEGAQPE